MTSDALFIAENSNRSSITATQNWYGKFSFSLIKTSTCSMSYIHVFTLYVQLPIECTICVFQESFCICLYLFMVTSHSIQPPKHMASFISKQKNNSKKCVPNLKSNRYICRIIYQSIQYIGVTHISGTSITLLSKLLQTAFNLVIKIIFTNKQCWNELIISTQVACVFEFR